MTFMLRSKHSRGMLTLLCPPFNYLERERPHGWPVCCPVSSRSEVRDETEAPRYSHRAVMLL